MMQQNDVFDERSTRNQKVIEAIKAEESTKSQSEENQVAAIQRLLRVRHLGLKL